MEQCRLTCAVTAKNMWLGWIIVLVITIVFYCTGEQIKQIGVTHCLITHCAYLSPASHKTYENPDGVNVLKRL